MSVALRLAWMAVLGILVIVMQTLWAVCTAGGDQTAIKRYMATRDAAVVRQSYLINSIAAVSVWLVLALIVGIGVDCIVSLLARRGQRFKSTTDN